MKKLEDRVAIVTGGGSGIGRAIALLFAQNGAHVVVNDIVGEAAERTVADMEGARGRARAIRADVADVGQVKAMFAEVERELGRLDVLVNNAGIAEVRPERIPALFEKGQKRMAETMMGTGVETQWDITQEMTDEDWHRMIGVHLHGTFYCTREALRRMTRGASIINMSSVAGLGGIEVAPHYGAAKAGIIGFTQSVALEVGSRGIRVNAICPGWIDTPMTQGFHQNPMLQTMVKGRTPLGRFGEADEIARTALFLAGEDGSFFTGQWLSPNGGFFMG